MATASCSTPAAAAPKAPSAGSVAAFVKRFTADVWPGQRRPALYYDPRSVAFDVDARASLHAKAVIVDRRKAFVTSANFTEAAQARNIEAGVVVDDTAFAERMARQLDALVEQGAVVGV
ncbi:MAG: hypothetical protein H6701_08330 [Myxococcales bacterium]|nr:hypothetical protein [Myxococcales bacterium]